MNYSRSLNWTGSFNFEKKHEAGEDAEPVCEFVPEQDVGLLAVFDGLGGAGSGIVVTDDGVAETGARMASKFCRRCLTELLDRLRQNQNAKLYDLFDRNFLSTYFDELFVQRAARLSGNTARLKSKMIRQLPTTFATAVYSQTTTSVHVRVLWSGDSRVYFMTKDNLLKLTTDHVRSEGSGGDAPLLHFISEVVPNFVDMKDYVFAEPGVLFCATDGAYGYFATDAHFQCLMLRSLLDDASDLSPSDRMKNGVALVAQDDASLSYAYISPTEAREGIADPLQIWRNRSGLLESQLTNYDTLSRRIADLESDVKSLKLEQDHIRLNCASAEVADKIGDANEKRRQNWSGDSNF